MESIERRYADFDVPSALPAGDFRFRMDIKKEEIAYFFHNTEEHSAIINERRELLTAFPHRHAALLPDAAALVNEMEEIFVQNAVIDQSMAADIRTLEPLERLQTLSMMVEPDLLLLRDCKLVGGCLCFPSYWSLEEKIGQTIEDIHLPVPGLNDNIGVPIRTFLERLKPGHAWTRQNWGLTSSPERNEHPAVTDGKIDVTIPAAHLWLRMEHQALIRLPKTNGILFAIHIRSHPMHTVTADMNVNRGLQRSLDTMSSSMADYKRITPEMKQKLMILLNNSHLQEE